MPASTTEIAVGASTWASGSQVWNGKTGTLMAKPINSNTQITLMALIPHQTTPSRAKGARSIMSNISNVFPHAK